MRESTAALYAMFGFVLSLIGAALAFTRGRAQSFYAAGVYHMTQRSHRWFGLLSVAFAAGFLIALRWPAAAVPLLAVYTLLLVLYATSFARGFSEEDE